MMQTCPPPIEPWVAAYNRLKHSDLRHLDADDIRPIITYDYVPGGPFSEHCLHRQVAAVGSVAHIIIERRPDNTVMRVTKIPSPEEECMLEFNYQLMLHEIEVYKVLDANPHPFVLQSLGSDPKNYALYLPWRGKTIDAVLQKAPAPPLEIRRKWCFQLASAVEHLHSLHIYHCDLSLGNLLIDRDGTLTVCDFGGSSMNFEAPRSVARAQFTIRCYRDKENWTPDDLRQIDILSLGSLLYVISTGGEWPAPPRASEEEVLDLYAHGVFPDTSSVFLGRLIEDIWHERASDIHDIVLRIITSFPLPNDM